MIFTYTSGPKKANEFVQNFHAFGSYFYAVFYEMTRTNCEAHVLIIARITTAVIYDFGHCLNILLIAFCTAFWFLLPLLFRVS